jgi:hypothetical protein
MLGRVLRKLYPEKSTTEALPRVKTTVYPALNYLPILKALVQAYIQKSFAVGFSKNSLIEYSEALLISMNRFWF